MASKFNNAGNGGTPNNENNNNDDEMTHSNAATDDNNGNHLARLRSQTNQKPLQFSTITAYLLHHNYRLGKVIGEGSYSKVRIATHYLPDGGPGQRHACKVINKQRASNDFVTKFLPRELEIIGKLRHPNIIRVFDMVQFDDNVYIFMDWCDKGDLLEYIKSHGNISDAKARYYFRQLMSAVHYLHNLDLAHRDLKCENILLKSQHDQIQLSDFGFARHCRERGKRILSSTYCGSAAYASPEILQGVPYNPMLYDIWSIGCILFIALTGHMPFDESNIPKMLKTQQDRILYYPPPSDTNVTDLAKSYIRRMLEPDVTRRFNIEQACNHEWIMKSEPGSVQQRKRPQTTPAQPAAAAPVETEFGDRDRSVPSPRQFFAEIISKNFEQIDHKNNSIPNGTSTRQQVPESSPPIQTSSPNSARNTYGHCKQCSPANLSPRASEPIPQSMHQNNGGSRNSSQQGNNLGTYYSVTTCEPSENNGRRSQQQSHPASTQIARHGTYANITQAQQIPGATYRQATRRQGRPRHHYQSPQ